MTKHKHWYQIRAFADGWKIEYLDELQRSVATWIPLDRPCFVLEGKYRVVPDEEGWLPWFGEDRMPDDVDSDCLVVVNSWDKSKGNPASIIDWPRVNKYRIVQEKKTDPYAELKAAAADPTKQIRVKDADHWREAGHPWAWQYRPEDYEIRDKPKTKKVKLFAYLTRGGSLSWYSKQLDFDGWKRVRSEDKEVEIEE